MRVYSEQKELRQVVCNACLRELKVENGFLREECVHVDHDFGFFGARDGLSHSFDLCEDCYQKIVAGFLLPPQERERAELL